MATTCCDSQCSSTEGPVIQPMLSSSSAHPEDNGKNRHARGDSTASAVSAGGTSPFHHHHHHQHLSGRRATTGKISAHNSRRGHKRTQSAGNYGFGAKDLSLYMATGLYAAHQMPPYRSFEYGFNEICNSGKLSNSDSNLSTAGRDEGTTASKPQSKHRASVCSSTGPCNRSRHRSHCSHRQFLSQKQQQQVKHQLQQSSLSASTTTAAAAVKQHSAQLLPAAGGVLNNSSSQIRAKSNESRNEQTPACDDEDDEEEYEYYSDEADDNQENECGILSIRPLRLQKYATIQVFVLLCCLLVTLNQALSSGYFNSVITTIEKRFDIPSRMTGLIASTFEIGNLITVIFVSYFGTHRHIPVWIGKGIIVTGLGSLIFSLAHFVPQDNPLDSVNMSHSGAWDDNICHIPEPLITSPLASASHFLVPDGAPDQPICRDFGSYRSPHLVIFVLAMILIGCGGTPIFTLGTIYIDDHVRQEDSSMYIGCMYSMVAFGLVVGFLLGGYFITIHENSFGTGIIPADIYPGHPKWIGAWWCGFVLLGILLILIAVPFFAFPRSLKRKRSRRRTTRQKNMSAIPKVNSSSIIVGSNKDKNEDGMMNQMTSSSSGRLLLLPPHPPDSIDGFNHVHDAACTTDLTVVDLTPACKVMESSLQGNTVATVNPNVNASTGTVVTVDASSDDAEYGRSIKEIPKCMWNLLSNPVYIVTCLGSCMELSIVSGFLVFLPKYLETQFTISKSEANLFAGGIAIPGACFGIFLGGFLLKKLQLGIKGAIQFVLFFNLVCMGLYTGLYFLGCDNMRMAGTTLPYHNSSSFEVPFQVNLTSECNNRCKCPPNEIEPICGKNGITYFSPCHAGCEKAGGPRHTQNYSNCACISDSSHAGVQYSVENADGVTVVPIARSGPCPQTCRAMIPFLVILFIVTLVVSITQMPLLMVTLRSVREEERAFALGMQFVIFRLFGYIPSPIVFGNVIDSTCLYWKANCGRQGGFCLIYNIEHFRLRYIGVCSGLKVAAGLLFFLDWILVCYNSSQESRKMMNKPLDVGVKQIVQSIVSLDKLSSVDAAGDHADRLELLEPGPDSDYNSAIDDIDADDDDAESSTAMMRKRQSSHC